MRQAYDRLVREGFDSYTILGIGDGGKHIATRLLKCGAGVSGNILLCLFGNGEPVVPDRPDILDKNILVCDDTTITGKTFIKVYTRLKEHGAADIKFLSFLMRKNSSIVPNIYIFETDEDTKVYFPWSDYPIRTYPKGIVRKMLPGDVGKISGVEDRVLIRIHWRIFIKIRNIQKPGFTWWKIKARYVRLSSFMKKELTLIMFCSLIQLLLHRENRGINMVVLY